MHNWVTDHCKTLKHLALLCFLSLFCGVSLSMAAASKMSINVYLKLKQDNQVAELIAEFNQYLEQHQIFSTYQIDPFQPRYPLHITLYLTEYQDKNLQKIRNKIQNLASKLSPLTIQTDNLINSPTGYIMLAVAPTARLRKLSNDAVMTLSPMRDKSATIPAWAAHDLKRRALFAKFGSPNVARYFKPHFSIIDPQHLSMQQTAKLNQVLKQLISSFEQQHHCKVHAVADALGIGIADAQGQIIQELASFTLK